jgi:putative ABC transport system ATP-binding protein
MIGKIMAATKYHFSFRKDLETALSFLHFEFREIFYVGVYATLIGVLSFGATISVQFLINSISFTGQVYPVVLLSGVTIVILFFVSALQIMSRVVVEKIQQRVLVRLALGSVDSLSSSSVDKRDWSRGEIVHRFFDVFNYQSALTKLLLDGMGLTITTFLGLLLVIFYHPLLALLTLIILIAFFLIVVGFFKKAVETNYLQSSQKYRLASWLTRVAEARNLLGSPARRAFAMGETDSQTKSYLSARQNHFVVCMWQQGSLYALQAIAAGVFLGMGGIFVVIGTINLGQLVAAEVILVSVLYGMVAFGKSLESFYDLMTSSEKMMPLLQKEEPRTGASLVSGDRVEMPLSIEIQSQHLTKSSTIRAGEVVALMGGDAFDRRALLWQLMGQSGDGEFKIQVGKIPFSEIEEDWRRRQILLIDASAIFNVDLRTNLTLRRPSLKGREEPLLLDSLPLFHIGTGPDSFQGPASDWAGEPRLRLHVSLLRAVFSEAKIILIDFLFMELSPQERAEYLRFFKQKSPDKILIVNVGEDSQTKDWTQVIEWTHGE